MLGLGLELLEQVRIRTEAADVTVTSASYLRRSADVIMHLTYKIGMQVRSADVVQPVSFSVA
jgi:hypothetical protein